MANELLDLIDVDPAVVHGQARFRSTRIPVSVVLDCLATDMTDDEIHAQYPSLPTDAVRAAIAYAALLAREELHPSSPRLGEAQARRVETFLANDMAGDLAGCIVVVRGHLVRIRPSWLNEGRTATG